MKEMKKKALFVFSGMLVVLTAIAICSSRQIHATPGEQARALPGDNLIPQPLGVGSVFPALPGATDVFVVAQCEREHSLVLTWRLPSGKYQTTWAFVLEEPQPGRTRLLVRGRVAPGYRPYGLPQWLALPTGALAHFIMQRKQLLGIARRAEALDRR